MQYGERDLRRGHRGRDVQEMQMRLAGFRGTVPDGIFGPGTELQVMTFQRDYMQRPNTVGIVDQDTYDALHEFARRFPVDFQALACPCGVCSGFGQGLYKGRYRSGMPRSERSYRYEYPGVHRMLLWSTRAVFFYLPELRFTITSGYRCSVNNEQKGRSSTNHHGKAIDLDVPLGPGEDKRDDMNRCNDIRSMLVETANAQIGWAAGNRKSLEPENIAPTWIHYDVRMYERKYLRDEYFCTEPDQLDAPRRSEL